MLSLCHFAGLRVLPVDCLAFKSIAGEKTGFGCREYKRASRGVKVMIDNAAGSV